VRLCGRVCPTQQVAVDIPIRSHAHCAGTAAGRSGLDIAGAWGRSLVRLGWLDAGKRSALAFELSG